MRRPREVAPSAQGAQPFASHMRLEAKAPAIPQALSCPPTPRLPPKHCCHTNFTLCPCPLCPEAEPLSQHLGMGPGHISSLSGGLPAQPAAPRLERTIFGRTLWSVVYTRGARPEDKMAASLGIVMEEERGGRGLQGRKGLSGPHTETGSTDLTEAPTPGTRSLLPEWLPVADY